MARRWTTNLRIHTFPPPPKPPPQHPPPSLAILLQVAGPARLLAGRRRHRPPQRRQQRRLIIGRRRRRRPAAARRPAARHADRLRACAVHVRPRSRPHCAAAALAAVAQRAPAPVRAAAVPRPSAAIIPLRPDHGARGATDRGAARGRDAGRPVHHGARLHGAAARQLRAAGLRGGQRRRRAGVRGRRPAHVLAAHGRTDSGHALHAAGGGRGGGGGGRSSGRAGDGVAERVDGASEVCGGLCDCVYDMHYALRERRHICYGMCFVYNDWGGSAELGGFACVCV